MIRNILGQVYEESLNTQALVDAAIKSQFSKKMEQVEKV